MRTLILGLFLCIQLEANVSQHKLKYKGPIQILVSSIDINCIKFDGEELVDIFMPSGAFMRPEYDYDTNSLYFSVGPAYNHRPFLVTFKFASLRDQQLVIFPHKSDKSKPIMGQKIILKIPKAQQRIDQDKLLSKLDEQFMAQVVSGNIKKAWVTEKLNKPLQLWSDLKVKVVQQIQSQHGQILVLNVQNKTKQQQILTEQKFSKVCEHIRAIKINNRFLKNKGTTNVYILVRK